MPPNWCRGLRCADEHTKISTDNYAAITKKKIDKSAVPSNVEGSDCQVTIVPHPASGFGVGITLLSLHTPPGKYPWVPGPSLEVFDGDSILSTVLASFSNDSGVEWPSGIRIFGSTTAGELFLACHRLFWGVTGTASSVSK